MNSSRRGGIDRGTDRRGAVREPDRPARAGEDEVAKVVIGQERAVELLLVAALARGHVLIEGPPGSAKTLLARAIAHMLGATFKRIQFTPDTTPAELTGMNTMRMGEQIFMPGVVFTNVLLADEINRTPPRTQAALLEAMQERQVTVEGKAHRLPDPFLVIATQNPFEHRDVFELPESQLDRFLFKILIDYSDAESEYRCSTCRTAASRRTCSARSSRCSASSASTRPGRARRNRCSRGGRALHGRDRAQRRARSRRRARRQLPRDYPPRERGEGERAPERPRRGHGRGRARDGAVRPPPPDDRRRGD